MHTRPGGASLSSHFVPVALIAVAFLAAGHFHANAMRSHYYRQLQGESSGLALVNAQSLSTAAQAGAWL